MRKIKFRAWDIKQKKMIYSSDQIFPCVTLNGSLFTADSVGYRKLNGFILMQYTGLKDCNGKEIYEGDIVSIPYINPLGRLDIDTETDRAEIIFAHGNFAIKRHPEVQNLIDWCEREEGQYISNYGNTTIIHDTTALIIIGNICENPELLKEQE